MKHKVMKKVFLFLVILTSCLVSQAQSFKEAAEQGDAEAQFQMGRSYYYGDDGVTQDYAKAVEWYRKAAD